MLTGVAVRIALRIGLHRDGALLGLPPFESEMRRRLWWQTIILDNRNAEIVGARFLKATPQSDTQIPLNCNDSDLWPGMPEPPKERLGASDMLFCSARSEVGSVFPKIGVVNPSGDRDDRPEPSMADKDRIVDELEILLETKYLRYCDLLQPLHIQTAGLCRGAVLTLRLQVHHPRQYPDNGASLPQEEKDMLFRTSLKLIDYFNMAYSTKSIRGFLWHTNFFIQWAALIYLLNELRTRVSGDEAENAWSRLTELFGYRPDIITQHKKALHTAVGNLILKAWAAYERECSHRREEVIVPAFIAQLRSQRIPKQTMSSISEGTVLSVPSGHSSAEPFVELPLETFNDLLDPSFNLDSFPPDPSPIDWAEWDALTSLP